MDPVGVEQAFDTFRAPFYADNRAAVMAERSRVHFCLAGTGCRCSYYFSAGYRAYLLFQYGNNGQQNWLTQACVHQQA